MHQDFGPGLTVDELIDMAAYQIIHLEMPMDKIFQKTLKAAKILIENGLESSILLEIWEDGYTGWRDAPSGRAIRVTPSGKVEQSKKPHFKEDDNSF